MSLFYYIHGGKVLEPYSISLEGINEVSSDYLEQQTKYVELSAEQIQFHLDNPNATAAEVWAMQIASSTLSNDEIRMIRQEQYKMRSDSLYMSYQKYLALGETDKAELARAEWLTEVELIDVQNPYNL